MSDQQDAAHADGPDTPTWLRVELAEAPTVELPVQVRTASLLPVTQAWTGQEISLSAGEYLVSVCRPGEATRTAMVRVTSGAGLTVSLPPPGPTMAIQTPAPALAADRTGAEVPASPEGEPGEPDALPTIVLQAPSSVGPLQVNRVL